MTFNFDMHLAGADINEFINIAGAHADYVY
ncbi:Uncharacterised protein [Pragia fontium]|nr:Uncharacterised protein [Pragia fontium]VEJ55174.1 Uncharacterised protein [Pragia fontium]